MCPNPNLIIYFILLTLILLILPLLIFTIHQWIWMVIIRNLFKILFKRSESLCKTLKIQVFRKRKLTKENRGTRS